MSEKRTIAPADKITVAEQYLAGKLTQTSAAKKYQVHIRTIQSWIRLYQVDGRPLFRNTDGPAIPQTESFRQSKPTWITRVLWIPSVQSMGSGHMRFSCIGSGCIMKVNHYEILPEVHP